MHADSPSKLTFGRRLLIVALSALAMLGLGAAPALAAYTHTNTDGYNFQSSNSAVTASGAIRWFVDPREWWQPAIYRGEHSSSSVVKLNRTGCLYVKLTWHTGSGTVSWPPSGSSSATSDGWYRKCGAAGTQLSLAGQAHAHSTLYKGCVSIGYSSSSSVPRSYQSNFCGWN